MYDGRNDSVFESIGGEIVRREQFVRPCNGLRDTLYLEQVLSERIGKRTKQRRISFEKLERNKSKRKPARRGKVRPQRVGNKRNRGFNGRRIKDRRLGFRDRRRRRCLRAERIQRGLKRRKCRPFLRGHADHGNAESRGKRFKVDPNTPAFRFVHQIDADNHTLCDLKHLQDEVEIALKTGCVTNDHDRIRRAETEKVARDLFLL